MSPLLGLLAAAAVLLAPGPAVGREGELAARIFEVRGPASERIAVLEAPAVEGDRYAVSGTVACEGVAGAGHLEMWSVFPDGSRYFSRTLEASGPMAKLSGTSAERAFTLPFLLTPGAPRPLRLELNVVLPGEGRVVVRGLRFESGAPAAAAPDAWWSPETAGFVGGAAGSAVGLLGAAIGALASLGRGRRFVRAGLRALAVTGVLSLTLGGVALALGQPYPVWYPLVLMGVLGTVLSLSLLRAAHRRFEALEPGRMPPLDAR